MEFPDREYRFLGIAWNEGADVEQPDVFQHAQEMMYYELWFGMDVSPKDRK